MEKSREEYLVKVECEFSWKAQHLVMSYVKRINHEIHFAWQAQYFVKVECDFPWQAKHD